DLERGEEPGAELPGGGAIELGTRLAGGVELAPAGEQVVARIDRGDAEGTRRRPDADVELRRRELLIARTRGDRREQEGEPGRPPSPLGVLQRTDAGDVRRR